MKMAQQRQPGVFYKSLTNEQGVAQFLKSKGASSKVIASIISRYPRAITRSIEHLVQRWELWRNIFKSDEEIVKILDRSPESFFRSSDNKKLEKNIAFLISLGLNTKELHRLLATAPRTFSNSVELNRQMVDFLKDTCVELGGQDPEQFTKTVISRNVYILIRSTKRVKTNINLLKTTLELSDSELLALLNGPGAEILDLSNDYLKKNLNSVQKKISSLGGQKADVNKMVMSYPMILFNRSDTLNAKVDCLLKSGITINEIVEKPRIFDYSVQNISGRLEDLKTARYDLRKNGIGVLALSKKRFDAKIGKLSVSPDD